MCLARLRICTEQWTNGKVLITGLAGTNKNSISNIQRNSNWNFMVSMRHSAIAAPIRPGGIAYPAPIEIFSYCAGSARPKNRTKREVDVNCTGKKKKMSSSAGESLVNRTRDNGRGARGMDAEMEIAQQTIDLISIGHIWPIQHWLNGTGKLIENQMKEPEKERQKLDAWYRVSSRSQLR